MCWGAWGARRIAEGVGWLYVAVVLMEAFIDGWAGAVYMVEAPVAAALFVAWMFVQVVVTGQRHL